LLLPALERTTTRLEEARMHMQLAQVALALSTFKAERGVYPQALGELAPGYLPEIPRDSFAELPLLYARTGDGFQLRSVGPNMTDDAGGKDDLVVDPSRSNGVAR
jgi:hypothetical protein